MGHSSKGSWDPGVSQEEEDTFGQNKIDDCKLRVYNTFRYDVFYNNRINKIYKCNQNKWDGLRFDNKTKTISFADAATLECFGIVSIYAADFLDKYNCGSKPNIIGLLLNIEDDLKIVVESRSHYIFAINSIMLKFSDFYNSNKTFIIQAEYLEQLRDFIKAIFEYIDISATILFQPPPQQQPGGSSTARKKTPKAIYFCRAHNAHYFTAKEMKEHMTLVHGIGDSSILYTCTAVDGAKFVKKQSAPTKKRQLQKV